MKSKLKNNYNGHSENVRPTWIDVTLKDGIITFIFDAKNCKYWCPYRKFNAIHSCGDCCEILIGSDPLRKVYYEIEVSPLNGVMIAKMTNNGVSKSGKQILLDIDFEKDNFVTSEILIKSDRFVSMISFPLNRIITGDGNIYFNAYRLETVGGKHRVPKQLLFALNPTMCDKFHKPQYFIDLNSYLDKGL